jgi:hypothetical protein
VEELVIIGGEDRAEACGRAGRHLKVEHASACPRS